MSKFKQLLALSTRLLEQEDTITVLRSELLTAEDSRDRVGADLAEALKIAKAQSVRAEALAAEVGKFQDRHAECSTSRDVLKSLGYEYADGAWMNQKPAAPSYRPLDAVGAIARLKELGYTWTGQEWRKQVISPCPLPPAPVAQPPMLPPAFDESADAKPSRRARIKCVHCGEVGHFSSACPTQEKPPRAKNIECVYCKETGHHSHDCPSREGSRASAKAVHCDNCSSSWHTSDNCPSVCQKGAK